MNCLSIAVPRDFGKCSQMFHFVWLRYRKTATLEKVKRVLTS